jgi:dTDP-4-dehydrorhamnose reductase
MLGCTVRRLLASGKKWCVDATQNGDPAAADYLDILAMPREQWVAYLRRRRYDYVVNCVGILKPAVNAQDALSLSRAIRVNALFPHELAETLKDARILHISTDGVFAGGRERPYVETDPTDCPDVYGKSKALGECPAENVLNFRCSIVGRDRLGGKGLMEQVLRAPEGSELTGFADHLWNGVTTNQFAELCRRVIESGAFERLRGVAGIYHFCPNPPITKYDLLCGMQTAAGRKLMIRRGHSGAPNRRILGSVYTTVAELFPGGEDWESLLRSAVESEG